jgi:molecular chaperone GrpE (heat shock protein)
MKAIPSKKPAKPTSTRKSPSPTPGAAGRKAAASHSRKATAATSDSPASARHEATGAPASTRLDVDPLTIGREILEEVRALRTAMLPAPLPMPSSTSAAEGDLETAVAAMRRLLSEWMERHMDQFLGELSAIRDTISDPDRLDRKDGLRRIDQLLERLGASSFSASKLDFVDPAIHEIVAERNLLDVPEGVVVETLRPGLRSASGAMICKARVAVNRKGTHESVGH